MNLYISKLTEDFVTAIQFDGTNIEDIMKEVIDAGGSIKAETLTSGCVPPTIVYYLNCEANIYDEIRISDFIVFTKFGIKVIEYQDFLKDYKQL